MSLYTKILYLHPDAEQPDDYDLQDPGTGMAIAYWNTGTLGAQPSQATFDALDTDPDYITYSDNFDSRRLRHRAKNAFNGDQTIILKALALEIKDQLNTLRSEHSLSPITNNQLFNAILDRIDELTPDGV